MKRMMIFLNDEEFVKLNQLAIADLRTINDHARRLLQGVLFGDDVISTIDDLTKRIEALEEAQRLREGKNEQNTF